MEEITLVDENQNKVSAIISIPPNAKSVVALSHGFGSCKERKNYKEFETELNAVGIGTVRYDYYGHGKLYCDNSKKSTYSVTKDVTLSKMVASLREVVSYIKKKGNYSIGLMGNSFGGLLSLIVASQDSSIKALALKSPVVEPISFWQNRLGDKRIKDWEKKGIMHWGCVGEDFDLEFDFWKDLQAYDTLTLAKQMRCPVLIVHGGADTIVPIKQSQALAKILGVQVRVVAGADHDYETTKQHNEMKSAIEEFLKEKLV
ncbi:Putative aminoacrylate hydrolase RutD [uncultured archaeon]|nr:Putative aminoacrylate hydrolase RutD [uncultured archaeon]